MLSSCRIPTSFCRKPLGFKASSTKNVCLDQKVLSRNTGHGMKFRNQSRFVSSQLSETRTNRPLNYCTSTEKKNETLKAQPEGGKQKFGWNIVEEAKRGQGTFKVVSYNILADAYAEPGPGRPIMNRPQVQGRIGLILRELEQLNSDIFCLQEVENGIFETQVRPLLIARGYDVEYCINPRANEHLTPEIWKDRVDGLLIAWKSSKFSKISVSNYELRQLIFEHPNKWGVDRATLQSLLKKDTSVSIVMLETTHVKVAKKQLCVATIHSYYGGDPGKNHVNALQTQLATHGVRKAVLQHAGLDPRKVEITAPLNIPVVFAGDFNSRPGSGTYELLTTGILPFTSTWLAYGVNQQKKSTSEDLINHLPIVSAYGSSPFGEPRVVQAFSGRPAGVVDYVWFTPSTLKLHKVLDVPTFEGRLDVRLPCAEHPSDHLPVGAEFSFVAPIEADSIKIQEPEASSKDKKEVVFVKAPYYEQIPLDAYPGLKEKKVANIRRQLGFQDEQPVKVDPFDEVDFSNDVKPTKGASRGRKPRSDKSEGSKITKRRERQAFKK